MSLYTQQFVIPDNGLLRIGTIGGSAFSKVGPGGDVKEGQEWQLGHMVPLRQGVLRIEGIEDDSQIHECSATILGYNNKPISNVKVPGRVIVELPCSVSVTGPAGLSVLVEAWELYAFPDRGACQSVIGEVGIDVPIWASSFDLATPGVATFRNSAGAIVGVVTGTVVNFSIPSNAATVDVAGGLANNVIVFRQQG